MITMNWLNVAFWLLGTLIVMLGPILLVHELAHFMCAKLAGVHVEEFGLGLPPRLLGLWRGKGHLRIGNTHVQIPRAFRLLPELETGDWVDAITAADDSTPVLKRLTVLDEDGHDRIPRREQTSQEARLRGEVTELEPGTLYSINLLPMGAFVRMTDDPDPRSLGAQPKRWRVAVMAAGPVINIVVALLLLVVTYISGVPTEWQVKIREVIPDTPAARAGLQLNDLIVTAGGEPINQGPNQLREIIRSAPEEIIQLEVRRGEESISLRTAPERRGEDGFFGIMMAPWPAQTGVQRYPLHAAFRASSRDLVAITRNTVRLPIMLMRGEVRAEDARPTSMVGISQIMTFALQQSIEWGLASPAIQMASLISLALGLTNLLPLPALDGGRILFVVVEVIRGRRISPEREAVVHFIGMMLLIALMLLVMLQDFLDPIIPWALLE